MAVTAQAATVVESDDDVITVQFDAVDSLSDQEVLVLINDILFARPFITALIDTEFFSRCTMHFRTSTLALVRDGLTLGYRGNDLWYFLFPLLLSRYVSVYRSVVEQYDTTLIAM